MTCCLERVHSSVATTWRRIEGSGLAKAKNNVIVEVEVETNSGDKEVELVIIRDDPAREVSSKLQYVLGFSSFAVEKIRGKLLLAR